MATTTTSLHRAQLLREMNRTRHSSGSSRHSPTPQPTVSDFDPENEALMSTQQLDDQPHKLPELRASAQKYRRPAPSESDYAIDTSAIGRAFPDFSQGSISSDDNSMSIELGRGAKKGSHGTIGRLGRSREYSSSAQIDLPHNSMDFSAAMIGNNEVMDTPPLKPEPTEESTGTVRAKSRGSNQARRASGLRNDIEPLPPAKTKDYGSGESRKGSDGTRRGLAAMHARVRDENDMSRISDERPPTTDLTVRKTRFGNGSATQSAKNNGLPTNFSTAKGLQTRKMTPQQTANRAATQQANHQSFVLPDLPNISELVSGVFEDGTPVFSLHGRPRASRFASRQTISDGQNHAIVTEIGVPNDDQAIFLSLKLLQDKVAVLEKSKAEAETAVQNLQEKNRQLQNEKSERRRASHRSDSAIGSTDSDDGDDIMRSGHRKAIIEKNRLESSVQTLQKQLDGANRKISTAENVIQNITQERDSAVSQLGVAYVTIEHLKAENEALKEENCQLKDNINQVANVHEAETQQWKAKEDALQQKLERRKEDATTVREQVSIIASLPQVKRASTAHLPNQMETSRIGQRQLSAYNDDDELFDLTPKGHEETDKAGQSKVSRSILNEDPTSGGHIREGVTKDKRAEKRARSHHLLNDETENVSKDLTYLSFFDNVEIAKLRKTLERERIEQKQRKAARHQLVDKEDANTEESGDEIQEQPTKTTVSRKSSLKEPTTKSSLDIHHGSAADKREPAAEHNRRHSETSLLSTRSRRRGLSAENMTSAFILPDITIRTSGDGAEKVANLSSENRAVLAGLTRHNAQNCTVCKRIVGHGETHEHCERARETVTVPKPIPVSERMPQPLPGEEDITMRPAQAPGLALATVLKGLEDEIAHHKIKLAQYQTIYNSHDPSLSKRKRKSCQQKIENLLQVIDSKADQIYALYDVLEGQKQEGQDLSEEQVEVTLLSIGVDLPTLHLRGGGQESKGNAQGAERHHWELSSEDGDEEELPWEGIEPATEATRSGYAGTKGRRASSVA